MQLKTLLATTPVRQVFGSVDRPVENIAYDSRRVQRHTMSPLHHHFELTGWKETTVIVRFWILSIIFALLGLATLKLR